MLSQNRDLGGDMLPVVESHAHVVGGCSAAVVIQRGIGFVLTYTLHCEISRQGLMIKQIDCIGAMLGILVHHLHGYNHETNFANLSVTLARHRLFFGLEQCGYIRLMLRAFDTHLQLVQPAALSARNCCSCSS